MATFGAGCFWQAEAAFAQHLGILKTSVGYMGGHFANPSYLDVLARITGHAEVAQIHYEQATVRYETLLNIFWRCHDPTTLNRQGPDRGEQYRSVIFYHTPEQAIAARRSKFDLEAAGTYPDPIVTQIKPATDYWLATPDHQQYFAQRSSKLDA
ncbi:MAG: peptide-methionine (S)-S-oxide reductase MsrA [Phormidesmis sp.]|jgi:peptide-methionine (S)-S-oxide reductase